MNNYIVYRHTCPNGKCYIGITGRSMIERWNGGHGYDEQFFGKAIRKYGAENITHEILHKGLTLEEAARLEQIEIAKHKSNDPAFGYNCTDGGEGSTGHKPSDEVRKKYSQNAKRMWQNPEIRARLLVHLQKLNGSRVGIPIQPEVKRKTGLANGIPICQYSLSGEYIRTFPTAMDAARAVGRESNSDIISCCKGRRKYAQGYIWRYEREDKQIEIIEPVSLHGKRKVVQMSLDGEQIKTFDSMTLAADAVGGVVQNIHHCIQGTRPTAYGYKWAYADTVS